MVLREFIITHDRNTADLELFHSLPLRSYEGHLDDVLLYRQIQLE